MLNLAHSQMLPQRWKPFQAGDCSESGRLLKHARYYWLLLAESHLTRRLFGAMVRRIDSLPLPAG